MEGLVLKFRGRCLRGRLRKPLVEGLVLKYAAVSFAFSSFRSPSWRGWY